MAEWALAHREQRRKDNGRDDESSDRANLEKYMADFVDLQLQSTRAKRLTTLPKGMKDKLARRDQAA